MHRAFAGHFTFVYALFFCACDNENSEQKKHIASIKEHIYSDYKLMFRDTMGRMHSDAQFAGSSSVPAHVEMMGFLGIGNNPMVGCTVAVAVDVATALSK